MTRMLTVLCTLLTMIGLSSVQAEEPTVITLSCDGMTKVYVKREEGTRYPIAKMSVVVNLAERTVLFDGRVAHIDHIDARTIFFGGDSVKDTTGYIDGKTGAMAATSMAMSIMNLSALPRLARSQGCTTSRRLTAAKLK